MLQAKVIRQFQTFTDQFEKTALFKARENERDGSKYFSFIVNGTPSIRVFSN